MSEEEYLKNRVAEQKKYFSLSAKKNKKIYMTISMSRLFLSLSIAILSPILGESSPGSIVVSILAAIIAFLDGVIFLKKSNENWINYRMTNEQLKKEECLFVTKSEKYFDLDEKDRFNMFVQNIESIIQNTNQNWEKSNLKKGGK